MCLSGYVLGNTRAKNAVEATLADACSNDLNEEVELDCRVEGGSGV